jgi:hypothetical protein
MIKSWVVLTRHAGAAVLAAGLALGTVACTSADESVEVEELDEAESEGAEQPDESAVDEQADAEAEQEQLDEDFATNDANDS